MAEFGAHLTSTTGGGKNDDQQPDIFEVLAQENLMSSLKPALSHVLRIMAESNPVRYGWLYRRHDEVYTLLDLLLQSYYLGHYDASFAENFYGIKRSPIHEKLYKLTRSQRFRSGLFLVLMPYIKQKCDKKYENLKEKYHGSSQKSQHMARRIQSRFVAVYPYFHLVYEGVVLCCHLLYALGKLPYHTPWLPLAGVHLKTLSEEDFLAQQAVQPSLDLANKNLAGKFYSVLRYGTGTMAEGVTSAISVGVFFLQFMEWWYSSDQHSKSLTALPNPSPPKVDSSISFSSSDCPVCQRTRSNDSALAVSGYVFCYPCVYRYVTMNGRCPVTGYPASTDHIVRLYLSNT